MLCACSVEILCFLQWNQLLHRRLVDDKTNGVRICITVANLYSASSETLLRDRQRPSERGRQTDRQKDRQSQRYTDRKTSAMTGTDRHTDRQTETIRQSDIDNDRDRQTDRHTDKRDLLVRRPCSSMVALL